MMQLEPLVAAGRAANHSQALYRAAPPATDLLPRLAAQQLRIARRMGEALAATLGVDGPQLRPVACEEIAGAALADRIAPLAANGLFSLAGTPHRVLLSIEAKAILAELDRTFGGIGEWEGELPAALPVSADMMAERLEGQLATTLAATLGCTLAPAARDTSLAALAPFAADRRLVLLSVEVGRPWKHAWRIAIAAPLDALPALLAAEDAGTARRRGPASPLEQPYADLPLALAATLVDMNVPISRLARLAPGTVLPVSVARAVPLSIGGTIVARGTIGELDDQAAVQLSQLFPS